MRNDRQHILHFSRRERNGIITLLIISIVAKAIPFFMEEIPPGEFLHDSSVELARLQFATETSSLHQDYSKSKSTILADAPSELFNFDPNTLNESGWVKLGLSPKAAASIRKYVSKGGRFYKPTDIRRIYGLKPELADRLEPYVQIAIEKKEIHKLKGDYGKNYPTQRAIDINRSDSADFESLPGIGPTLAKRILTFREKLGGFYSVDQVAEVYGLPDSIFKKIRARLHVASSELIKININTADKETLQSHPYIRYKLALLIIAYRQQHGNFQQVQDVKNIVGINEAMYEKMEPYLVIE